MEDKNMHRMLDFSFSTKCKRPNTFIKRLFKSINYANFNILDFEFGDFKKFFKDFMKDFELDYNGDCIQNKVVEHPSHYVYTTCLGFNYSCHIMIFNNSFSDIKPAYNFVEYEYNNGIRVRSTQNVSEFLKFFYCHSYNFNDYVIIYYDDGTSYEVVDSKEYGSFKTSLKIVGAYYEYFSDSKQIFVVFGDWFINEVDSVYYMDLLGIPLVTKLKSRKYNNLYNKMQEKMNTNTFMNYTKSELSTYCFNLSKVFNDVFGINDSYNYTVEELKQKILEQIELIR